MNTRILTEEEKDLLKNSGYHCDWSFQDKNNPDWWKKNGVGFVFTEQGKHRIIFYDWDDNKRILFNTVQECIAYGELFCK